MWHWWKLFEEPTAYWFEQLNCIDDFAERNGLERVFYRCYQIPCDIC